MYYLWLYIFAYDLYASSADVYNQISCFKAQENLYLA